MENQTLSKDGTQLDPSVVALAKAMRRAESNENYSAPGKSGEYGAYQFTEPTWKAWAGKYLNNPNADVRDPVNQDKVAYYRILERKQAGLTPEQITSEWNSGNPNAYLENHRGVNKYGVMYDTPSHVNKVMGYYSTLKNEHMLHRNQGAAVGSAPSPTGPITPSGLTMPDVESGQQYGAFFPSKTGEGPIAAGAKAVGNIPSSALYFGKNLASAVAHPIRTIEGVGNLAGGLLGKTLNKFTGTTYDTPATQMAERLGEYANKRYGTSFGDEKFNVDKTLQTLQRTATNDPLGFGADVLTLLKGGAKLADVATGSKVGKGGELLAYNDRIRDTTKHVLADPDFTGNVTQGIQSMKDDLILNFSNKALNADPQIIAKISKLDPTKFSSVDDFAQAASKAIGAKGLYSDLLNRGIQKTADIGLAPVRAVGRGARNVLGSTLGVSTGEGGTTVNTALKQAMQGGDARAAFREALRGKYTPEEIVDEAKEALRAVRQTRSQTYTQNVADLADNTIHDLKPLYDAVDDNLSKFNIQKTAGGGLDFSRSKFALDTVAQKDIKTLVDYVRQYGTKADDATTMGLDNLKQVLGGYYSPNSDYRAFVQGVKNVIWDPSNKGGILKDVPGYAKLTSQYADDTQFIEQLEKTLSLGGKAAVDTTFKKLISSLKDNNPARNALVTQLNEYSKGGLLPKIAGSDMSQVLPGGLTGLIEKTGGVYALLSGHGLPALTALLTVASPRVVGEFINALGITSQVATKMFSGLGVPNAAFFVANALKHAGSVNNNKQ